MATYKDSLKPSEWVLSLAILMFITSFILIAKIRSSKASSELDEALFFRENILVTISGAVKKPGDYFFLSGVTMEQALRKARPCRFANLKALPLKKIIDCPMHIEVEELKEIKVLVSGAIAEPLCLVLPPNSRISDLKSKVVFTKETETSFFRRKTLLKDGDEIRVPNKTVE